MGLVSEGRRFKHEPSRGSWISCAVFCRTDRGFWYAPRTELGREAFFPDGTWCHRDSAGQDHYCQKNLCLPEGYEFSEALRAAHASAAMEEGDDFIVDNEIIQS